MESKILPNNLKSYVNTLIFRMGESSLNGGVNMPFNIFWKTMDIFSIMMIYLRKTMRKKKNQRIWRTLLQVEEITKVKSLTQVLSFWHAVVNMVTLIHISMTSFVSFHSSKIQFICDYISISKWSHFIRSGESQFGGWIFLNSQRIFRRQ
jgi:hypothetical protein